MATALARKRTSPGGIVRKHWPSRWLPLQSEGRLGIGEANAAQGVEHNFQAFKIGHLLRPAHVLMECYALHPSWLLPRAAFGPPPVRATSLPSIP